jgi:hypothetical protein
VWFVRRASALALLATVGLGACGVGAVSEIVPEDESRFDARLLGAWVTEDGRESATITGDSASGYEILYRDTDGKENPLEARLGTIGGFAVLDVRPAEVTLAQGDIYTSLLLRLHAPLVIDSVGRILRFRLLESDSLEQFLEREPGAVPHTLIEHEVVLTARTPELRRFLAAFLRRPGVLGEPATWMRPDP